MDELNAAGVKELVDQARRAARGLVGTSRYDVGVLLQQIVLALESLAADRARLAGELSALPRSEEISKLVADVFEQCGAPCFSKSAADGCVCAAVKDALSRSDAGRVLDWLERQHVIVRTPLRYGSREDFMASPDEDGGPSDLRAKVTARLPTKDPR